MAPLTGEASAKHPGAKADETSRAGLEGRRRERLEWPLLRFDLGCEPGDDLSAQTTANERLAMVWPLTLLSFRLAGREIPGYERSRMPGAVVRADPST